MDYDPLLIGRVVIVQPEPPAELAGARLEVGLLAWRGPFPRVSLILKSTLRYARDPDAAPPPPDTVELARLDPDPMPLSLEQPSIQPDADPDEVYYPCDFVPRKSGVDILVVGNAYASEATQSIEGQIAVGGWGRFFAVEGDEPARAQPLYTNNLQPAGDSFGEPMGPMHQPAFEPDRTHDEQFDFRGYNSAAPRNRAQIVPPDARIRLVGLSAAAPERIVQLPGYVVRARAESGAFGDKELELVCDTVWIDTELERIVLVWRGDFELTNEVRELARFVVALEPKDHERTWPERLRYCQRGLVHYAVREADLAPGAEPIPVHDWTLQAARYQTWGSPAPEPVLPLDSYALIAAELSEWPDKRKETLERHDLTEDRWTVEERGWLEKMAARAQEGDARLAGAYSDKFMAAQDSLARPEELERTARDYAFILVELENNIDLQTVLHEQGLTLSAWLRLDRRFTKARAKDASVNDEIDHSIEEHRAARAKHTEDAS
jgi:hypothetical protein